jgi:hypothetical protein
VVSKTTAGDEALELLRDGALDSFSVGFAPIRHVKRDKVTVRTEVALREASLVTFPAYEDALVQAVRSMEGLTDEDRAELVQMLAESTDLQVHHSRRGAGDQWQLCIRRGRQFGRRSPRRPQPPACRLARKDRKGTLPCLRRTPPVSRCWLPSS